HRGGGGGPRERGRRKEQRQRGGLLGSAVPRSGFRLPPSPGLGVLGLLCREGLLQQDVGGLEVAVQHAALVGGPDGHGPSLAPSRGGGGRSPRSWASVPPPTYSRAR